MQTEGLANLPGIFSKKKMDEFLPQCSRIREEPFVLRTLVTGGDFPSDPTISACQKSGWITNLSPLFFHSSFLFFFRSASILLTLKGRASMSEPILLTLKGRTSISLFDSFNFSEDQISVFK